MRQMVEDFCLHHAPGSQVFYVGNADEKRAVCREVELAELGITADKYDRLPDLVACSPDRSRLLLLEDASAHGPIDEHRRAELASLFAGSAAELVYVSCFPSRAAMREHLAMIAWDTAAWCAEEPTHLIHFRGDRLLGPYAASGRPSHG